MHRNYEGSLCVYVCFWAVGYLVLMDRKVTRVTLDLKNDKIVKYDIIFIFLDQRWFSSLSIGHTCCG
jgi:hypothetical protein